MMSKRIRILIFLVMTLFCINVNVSEAKTKKITLYVGETKLLKVKTGKGHTKWNSSQRSIVKVSKRGKVTALKQGKVKITAQRGKVRRGFSIKVRNSYYKADFTKVAKVFIRNLTFGTEKEITSDVSSFIKSLQTAINRNRFYRKIYIGEKPNVGAHRYKLLMYDHEGNEIINIALGGNSLRLTQERQNENYQYVCDREMDLSIIDSMM